MAKPLKASLLELILHWLTGESMSTESQDRRGTDRREKWHGQAIFPENIGPRLEYWSVLYKLHAAIAVGGSKLSFNALTSKGTTVSVVLSLQGLP